MSGISEDDRANIQALIDAYDDWQEAGQMICGRIMQRSKQNRERYARNLAQQINDIRVKAGDLPPCILRQTA